MIGISTLQKTLLAKASTRLHKGLTDSISSCCISKFRLFLAFCYFIQVDFKSPQVDILLAFLEFLVQNNTSYSSLSNTVSALKSKFSMYGLSTSHFEDRRIFYYLKSVKINRPLLPRPKPIIDIPLLEKIVLICDTMYQGFIFKAAYLTAFFSFLRISNLVPYSIATFSNMKQLARADVIFSPPGALLVIKWSKTMQ